MEKYLELKDLFGEETAEDRILSLAKRLKDIRKRRKISQSALADRSFVSLGSIKRFESSGQISLASLYRLAIALGVDQELDSLFRNVPPTFEEMQHGAK